MWKLVGDHPAYGSAYLVLHDYYASHESPEQAEKVVATWRRAEPQGLAPRLVLARDELGQGRLEAAEVLLGGLFDDFGDDPGVLAALAQLYTQTGRTRDLLTRLEDRVAKEPRSFNAAERLARAYLNLGRTADAVRVLDAAASAASGEPDVLYDLSSLYTKAGQGPQAEEVLKRVLDLDPSHSGAGNDLGYLWAEQGKNLDRAEALTRAAADAEPENPSLLDSLGWVLYKRGRFGEARQVFERALALAEARVANPDEAAPENGPGNKPETKPGDKSDTRPAGGEAKPDAADPVLLDHLGDVMYRLNDPASAGRFWERCQRRLAALGDAAAERDDLKPLKLQIQQKRRQLQAGQPVAVAPVVEEPPTTRPVRTGAATGP